MRDPSSRWLGRLERHLIRGVAAARAANGPRPEPDSHGEALSRPVTSGLRREIVSYGAGGQGFPPDLFGEEFDPEDFRGHCARMGPVVFWDLETCGLGDVPIFMMGLLRYDTATGDAGPTFELLLAADPSAEPAMLREGIRWLGGASSWVSFNGRSFDYPRLKKRLFRHELPVPDCGTHIDLLLHVRRRWRGRLPDCRLGTVERRLLGLERAPGEVPGREVPQRYDDFVRTGDYRWIEPVVEHNRRDVLAMAALLTKLAALDPGLLQPDASSRR